MDEHRKAEWERAQGAVANMIERGAKAQAKFAPGTAQHSLQENRINALRIAAALMEQACAGTAAAAALTKQELEKARAPLASLMSKSEKAQGKLVPGSWQHRMLEENLHALRLAAPLLEKALGQGEAKG